MIFGFLPPCTACNTGSCNIPLSCFVKCCPLTTFYFQHFVLSSVNLSGEKYFIVFRPNLSDLNSKREIYSNCRHKPPALLVLKGRKSRKNPQDKKISRFTIHLCFVLSPSYYSQPDESESLKLLVAEK